MAYKAKYEFDSEGNPRKLTANFDFRKDVAKRDYSEVAGRILINGDVTELENLTPLAEYLKNFEELRTKGPFSPKYTFSRGAQSVHIQLSIFSRLKFKLTAKDYSGLPLEQIINLNALDEFIRTGQTPEIK